MSDEGSDPARRSLSPSSEDKPYNSYKVLVRDFFFWQRYPSPDVQQQVRLHCSHCAAGNYLLTVPR
jgi:hypothetical protein